MPVVFDFVCRTESCPLRGRKAERLLKKWSDPNPVCEACGSPTERLPAAPKAIWMKPYGEYGFRPGDEKNPNYSPEGIWAYRKRSSRNPDGSPEKVFLRTRQEVQEYCKQEGYYMPDEISSNAEISDDGKDLSTAGMPSQWA